MKEIKLDEVKGLATQVWRKVDLEGSPKTSSKW